MDFLIEQVADQYDKIEKSIKYDDPFRKYIFILLAVLIISFTLSIVAFVKQWAVFTYVFASCLLVLGVFYVVDSKNDRRFFKNENNLKQSLYKYEQLYICLKNNQYIQSNLNRMSKCSIIMHKIFMIENLSI